MSAERFVLASPARFVQEIRKSKFVANASNVTTPDAALEFIERIADRSATHNCWAYRIGLQYRFSDDGEPSGTAGKPILQAIDAQSIDQAVVVVIRWFGGIKLGAGGLARAYGGCAAECLRSSARRPLIDTSVVEVAIGFGAVPLLHARLADLQGKVVSEQFDVDGAVLRMRVPQDRIDGLRALIADLSRGRARMRVVD